jgi:hypothetical protein
VDCIVSDWIEKVPQTVFNVSQILPQFPTIAAKGRPQADSIDFPRKITVHAGFVELLTGFLALMPSNPRFWIPSSFQSIPSRLFILFKPLRLLPFEFGCHLQRIEFKAFYGSGLRMIVIPSSVEILCQFCFQFCKSLRWVNFESGSILDRIEDSAFRESR